MSSDSSSSSLESEKKRKISTQVSVQPLEGLSDNEEEGDEKRRFLWAVEVSILPFYKKIILKCLIQFTLWSSQSIQHFLCSTVG